MRTVPQPQLPHFEYNTIDQAVALDGNGTNGRANKLDPQDQAFHDWYRFVLSFPPHLVRHYLKEFGLKPGQVVLDPFCGTGTMLVESRLAGMRAVGIEANPFAWFASSVKVNWDIDPELMRAQARQIAHSVRDYLAMQGIDDDHPFEGSAGFVELKTLQPEATELLLTDSISPIPLHKVLVLVHFLRQHSKEPHYNHELLALANALVYKISNLRFGPEVGVGKPKQDTPVLAPWLDEIEKMATDLRVADTSNPQAVLHHDDAREVGEIIPPNSVDAVITSPPYPNEKDYTRTTRLESVVLGFVSTKLELRKLKKGLVRSNTRSVYQNDDDYKWIDEHEEIWEIADAIEERRKALGKDSGFENYSARHWAGRNGRDLYRNQ